MSDSRVSSVDSLAINTIRFLAVDMVEAARSGHPGAPMGQAALAYRLWSKHMRHDPAHPEWPNRDRFVLSCGHASALIYGLLHLSGYDLSLDELKRFRQLHSHTPGHPEYGDTVGVETTTGPLGQGLANGVGMAMAERMLAARFNRDGHTLVDHRVWVVASDGDLMEGVTSEASSLAGHLGLDRLTVFYDANQISIDGSTDLAFTEDVAARYRAYGWHTVEVEDGNDLASIDAAVAAARAETERPTLVLVRTHIGFGSPNKQDTAASHGSPLGADEVALTKDALGWPQAPTFHVPDEARDAFAGARRTGAAAESAWRSSLERYGDVHPELAAEFERLQSRDLADGWGDALPAYTAGDTPIATRKVSGAVVNAVAGHLPELIGGSADLAGSNNTMVKGAADFQKGAYDGRNLYFGVREHAMGALMNGMALSGMLRPYGGTFLMFTDYMRPAIRLAALMKLPALYIMTHDSIFLGEDGPTHQPISQLLSMRSIPGLTVFRPADGNETVAAWRAALENSDGPTLLALTRQKLPHVTTPEQAARGIARGGYVLVDAPDGATPALVLLATGSEVSLVLEAQEALAREGIPARVVSMPCWSRFDAQEADYRHRVLPPTVTKRLAVEAGTTIGWHKYVGLEGDVLGIDGYGASAPAGQLAEAYGFTAGNVVARAKAMLG